MDPRTFSLKVCEIRSNAPQAPQPEGVLVPLKPHQLALLQKCIHYETRDIAFKDHMELWSGHHVHRINENDYMHTHMGIIGDKVGSGKSYVMLALILSMTAPSLPRNYRLQTFGNNKLVLYEHEKMAVFNTSVLVIPHNLVNQWKDYIDKFSSTIKYAMINNAKGMEPFEKRAASIADFSLIVVTAAMHNSLANLLLVNQLKLRRVFYDEVDSMNIPSAIEMPAQFYWFVTASYGNMLYPRGHREWDQRLMRYNHNATGLKNSGFIKNLFTDLMVNQNKKLINLLVIKNDDAFVDACFNMVTPDVRLILSKEPSSISVLNGIVERNIMECLNAGDERTAIEMIDWRRKNSEQGIIEIMIQKFSDDIHNLTVQQKAAADMSYANAGDRELRVARFEERRKAIEEKVRSIKERITDTQMCPICYDDIHVKSVTTCCNNAFCFKCIHTWMPLTNSCPLCKSNISAENIYVVSAGGLQRPAHEELPPSPLETGPHNDKVRNLMAILRQRDPDSKFLVFSNYDNSFAKLSDELACAGIRFGYLKGNKSSIQARLSEFRSGVVPVLLVNATQYGSGLNLECTTDVVMFHKCDSEIEKQVVGRAQRAGRAAQLRVWYLLHSNEARVAAAAGATPAAGSSNIRTV
jgi:SNF2 family DNA or RNA helicase